MAPKAPLPFLEPPTPSSLADARRRLDANDTAFHELTLRIDTAKAALRKTVEEQRTLIHALQDERAALQGQIEQVKGYLAPMRRLPHELLRVIFMLNFEESPTVAWTLAAVCTVWRQLVLSMPKMWSKINLVTSPTASADTIRLWLERSGSREPLDIEITLQVQKDESSTSPSSRPRLRSLSPWPPHGLSHVQPVHYIQLHTDLPNTSAETASLPATIITLPPSPPPVSEDWGEATPPSPSTTVFPVYTSAPSASSTSCASIHWGHIAIFYLVEQMHRWKRFVFRFDKQFQSWHALKSITGAAPLLEEFEISCAEPAFYSDLPWLPSSNANAPVLPSLSRLTLKFAPFKWCSPMLLRSGLRSLTLQALPATSIALDRILHIISSNRNLEDLALCFNQVLNPVLPLSATTLPELTTLNISGHYSLASLFNHIVAPSLETLVVDIEARDPIEENISQLLTRSSHPPVRHLALGYTSAHGSSYYYNSGGLVASWTFLADLPQLRTLHVGATPLDPLFAALAAPEDDGPAPAWLCPHLTTLALKTCPAHTEGILKLVQMVEGRNPEGVGNAAPVKLRHLEMIECTSVGQDVTEWLRTRIENIVCIEPLIERPPHSPTYAYL